MGEISLHLDLTACGGLKAIAHTLTRLGMTSRVTSDDWKLFQDKHYADCTDAVNRRTLITTTVSTCELREKGQFNFYLLNLTSAKSEVGFFTFSWFRIPP